MPLSLGRRSLLLRQAIHWLEILNCLDVGCLTKALTLLTDSCDTCHNKVHASLQASAVPVHRYPLQQHPGPSRPRSTFHPKLPDSSVHRLPLTTLPPYNQLFSATLSCQPCYLSNSAVPCHSPRFPSHGHVQSASASLCSGLLQMTRDIFSLLGTTKTFLLVKWA